LFAEGVAENHPQEWNLFGEYGGEGGIRTLDRVVRPYNGLAIVDEPPTRFGTMELHPPKASLI
jgi:hypothetical protein